MVFTYPHMLFADPEYQNYVEGYHREPEKHQTEVLVEPVNIILKQYKLSENIVYKIIFS